MKGFRFRLEPVLRLRRHALEARRLELARARVAARSAQVLRDQASEALRRAQGERAERMAEGIPAGDLRALQDGVEHWLGEVARAAAAVRDTEAQSARCLAAMTAARREVRALEILREKALAEHRRELERREQAELDEVGGRAHSMGTPW